jgi:hypothetical protein
VRRLRWGVALAILVLTCLPAAVWHQPTTDLTLAGFDPNLVYVSPGGTASRDRAILTSSSDQRGQEAGTHTLSLVATPLRTFVVSVRVVIPGVVTNGVPVRLGVWSVFTGAGYFLEFIPSTKSIQTQDVVHGQAGRTLEGGEVTRTHPLGAYVSDQSYLVQFDVDKRRAITLKVSGDSLSAKDSVTTLEFPELLRSSRVALTASIQPSAATTQMILSDYSLRLPHQTYWATKVVDARERFAMIAALMLAVLLVGAAGVDWLALRRRRLPASITGRERCQRVGRYIANCRGAFAMGSVAAVAYLLGNSLLFGLGGHPFDMGVETLYAYVGRVYGPVQLYFLPNTVSLAGIWDGVPYIEAAFPYEPVIAYLSSGIGWLASIMFAGGAAIRIDDVRIEYVIKAVNVLFGLADGALLYLILWRLGVSQRWRFIAVGLFLFNPAVWFSMSVWGQTHVISIFFVLAAVLFLEMGIPLWAWIALVAACLTRPQMLVFGLLLGIVLFRRFSLKENAIALSWTVIVSFLALAPFTLVTSPSLPIDIMINVFRIQEAGGNELVLTTVSQDAYSIWPLVTYAAHGASGLQRAFTPSSHAVIGSLSYQSLSQVLTIAGVLAVSGALLFGKRAITGAGAYLPYIALGITSFLMLLTGLVATHFLLALPFLLLTRRWLGGVAYFYVVTVWSVTTFVPMFGDMGIAISSSHYPLLAPANNAITRLVVHLYVWDRFITVGVAANICAVIWLAYSALRSAQSSHRPLVAPQ